MVILGRWTHRGSSYAKEIPSPLEQKRADRNEGYVTLGFQAVQAVRLNKGRPEDYAGRVVHTLRSEKTLKPAITVNINVL